MTAHRLPASLFAARILALAIAFGSPAPLSAADEQWPQDQQFVTQAAVSGAAEVELGALATEKAANDGVKRFGALMVEEHNDINDELRDIAEDEGLGVPQTMSEDSQQLYQQLSNLSGAEFDRQYVDHMVQAHEKDVALFEQEANEGLKSELKDFAERTLPTLREHLVQAQVLQAELSQ